MPRSRYLPRCWLLPVEDVFALYSRSRSIQHPHAADESEEPKPVTAEATTALLSNYMLSNRAWCIIISPAAVDSPASDSFCAWLLPLEGTSGRPSVPV